MSRPDPFGDQIVAILPAMTAFSRYLCKSRDQADDLVQDTIVKALGGRDSFEVGTNLKAWLFTIMRNLRINSFRRRAPECLDDVPEPTVFTDADMLVDTHAMIDMMKFLPPDMAAVLSKIGVGDSYDDIADEMGINLGTVKSKVNRARMALEILIEGRGLNRTIMMEAA